MKPYPWREKRRFHERRSIARLLERVTGPLQIVAIILGLGIPWVVGMIALWRFRVRNDSRVKRGALLALLGLLLMPFLGTPVDWFHHLMDLPYSFGEKRPDLNPKDVALDLLLAGVPVAFILQGIVLTSDAYAYDRHAEAWLRPTLPSLLTHLRAWRSRNALRSGKYLGDGWMRFGVITDDPIPWRTPRYGMIVERPVESLGHGSVVGTNGAGKSVLALSMLYQAAHNGMPALFLDFKASYSSYAAAKATAHQAGVPFYSFDLGINTGEQTWWDLLAWDGHPSDKASMLVSSFSMDNHGTDFFRTASEMWMTMQFEVLAEVGLRDGEGTFDFLLDTATPEALRERMEPLKESNDPAQQELFRSAVKRIPTIEVRDIAGLRNNLHNAVSVGRERLRPQPGVEPITLSRIAANGGIAYIGLSPSLNDIAVKMIGGLILRDLGVLVATRVGVADRSPVSPILAIVDEASRMGGRAATMDNLFTQAREAKINLWTFTQTYSTWPESTQREIANNASNRVIFRAPGLTTAREASDTFGSIPVLNVVSEERVTHTTLRGETTEMDGGARQLLQSGPMIPAEDISSDQTLPNAHAYIELSGSVDRPTRAAWKSKRVRNDEIAHDVPLVRIVAPDLILNPPTDTEPANSQIVTSTSTSTSTSTANDDPTLTAALPDTAGSDEETAMGGPVGSASDEQRGSGPVGSASDEQRGSGARAPEPTPAANPVPPEQPVDTGVEEPPPTEAEQEQVEASAPPPPARTARPRTTPRPTQQTSPAPASDEGAGDAGDGDDFEDDHLAETPTVTAPPAAEAAPAAQTPPASPPRAASHKPSKRDRWS